MKPRDYLLEGPAETVMPFPPDSAHMSNLLDTLYAGRKTILIATVICTLAGSLYALLSTPVYESDMLIQVEESPNAAKSALADLSSQFAIKTGASAEMEVLRSRMVVSSAVNSTKLYIQVTPRYFPVVGRWVARHLNLGNWSGWGGYAWGDEAIDVTQFDVPARLENRPFVLTYVGNGAYTIENGGLKFEGIVGRGLHAQVVGGAIDLVVQSIDAQPGTVFNLKRQSELSAIQTLQNSLAISEKGKESDVIGVQLDGEDAVLTSTILNAIGNEYIRQNAQRTQEEAEKQIAFLDKQLPVLKEQLEKAENEYNAFRSAHGAVNLGAEATALLQSSALAQQRIADLRQQRAQLMARFTDDNPALVAVDGQLAEAAKSLQMLVGQTRALPPVEQQLVRLQREVTVDTNIYTNLLNSREQLRLLKAGRISNVRMIDEAVPAEAPIRPKRAVLMMAAMFTGLFVGAAIVLMRQRLNRGVSVVDEIEAGTGLAVYAAVPRSRIQYGMTRRLPHGQEGANTVLAHTAMFDPAVESLRSFRSALEHSMQSAANRVVLLAGPTPMVGKSFVSINLAAVFGASQKRVLLVDADLRRGTLNHHMSVPSRPGVTDIVEWQGGFEELVHRDVMPGVDFVATGGYVANASELLRDGSFKDFVDWADASYDIVLIDAPPVLPVADAGIIGKLAGTVFVIARQGATSVAELRESVRRFEQVGVPIRGVIFNDMTSRPGRYGNEYAAYGYSSYGFAKDARGAGN
ncbi:tyrosine-protein kinase Etk/Wzc [Paraburkholderia bannensis]|uniref:Tyrosine-protein kinase Etk/Wzc n=1 Tax=Paraburkholderia bannensis TaxID=765414 RepID=A0A7W9WSY1_9BURK|nr:MULTISPECIES: GNVR domain-containing protein [Paraburkholderia]MBB3257976.1 tyrosine-protein kinase Etk/Wzc [Paraburkholderia sp. WP4_3_2]MBB6102989.1 tyrosine-protein kinase Etk/Wzc [Paraburkholderia bannensis]